MSVIFQNPSNILETMKFRKLNVVLDLHLSDKTTPSTGTIIIKIGAPQSYISGSYFTILPGYQASLKISTMVQTISDSLPSLDPEKRNCFLSHENIEDSFFSKYNQENCEYECASRYLLISNFSCMPWDLPVIQNDLQICSGHDARQFKDELLKVKASNRCLSCLQNCEKEVNTRQMDMVAINAPKLCLNEAIFNATTSQEEEILLFRNKHSIPLGYLQVVSFAIKLFCHYLTPTFRVPH